MPSSDTTYLFDGVPVDQSYLIGVAFAVFSSVFIGISFIVKKISLRKLSESEGLAAGDGGFGYLKDWLWWSGLVTMGLGEFLNLIAYGYAPATVVTPLGALSVLVSAVMASKYLDEHLTKLGKFGCLLCVIGSVIIILNAPKEVDSKSVLSVDILFRLPMIIYSIIVVIFSFIIICYLGPKYGNDFVLVYVILCSLVGSFTVTATQFLALSIRDALQNEYADFKIIIFSVIVLGASVLIQLTYLNRSLDIFGPSIVTPAYYVTFTTLVLLFSCVLYQEWKQLTVWTTLGTLVGVFIAFVSTFMISQKEPRDDENRSLKSVSSSSY